MKINHPMQKSCNGRADKRERERIKQTVALAAARTHCTGVERIEALARVSVASDADAAPYVSRVSLTDGPH